MTSRRRILVSSLLTLLLWPPAGAGQGVTRAPGVGERVVRLVVSTKGEDEPVPTLRPEDVRVTEGGVERPVVSLARSDAPLHVALVVDVSGSQEHLIEGTKRAAAEFVRTVLRPGRDQAAVVSFAGKATVAAPLSPDLDRAAAALLRLKFEPPSGYIGSGIVVGHPPSATPDTSAATSLWDTAAFVAREVFPAAPAEAARVVVLLSDGYDTASQTKKQAALKALLDAGVVVYSVGVGDTEVYSGLDKGALRKLAEETGGVAVFPRKANDLAAAFAKVRDTLRGHHLLTYSAPAAAPAGKTPRLKVEVVSPELRRRGLRLGHPPR